MLEKDFQTLPIRPTVYPFGRTVISLRMRGKSASSDFSSQSWDSLMFPHHDPYREGQDLPRVQGSLAVLPPIERSENHGPEATHAQHLNAFQFWKQHNQKLGMQNKLFPSEPGATRPPQTTFETTFTPREVNPRVTIHSRRRPNPQHVAKQIVPTDSGAVNERLLPSVDREKMAELPSYLGRSKKIVDPPTKASGVFYTEGEVVTSQTDLKYWKSLTALWGKESSRKRELFPGPTAMAVHYFNGGAPGSPIRLNRRTNMHHKRSDSSRVDFSQSLYGKDEDKNFV